VGILGAAPVGIGLHKGRPRRWTALTKRPRDWLSPNFGGRSAGVDLPACRATEPPSRTPRRRSNISSAAPGTAAAVDQPGRK